MSEQVVDIRDRIEKMRTQMTGPKSKVTPVKGSNKDKITTEKLDEKKINSLGSSKKKSSPKRVEQLNARTTEKPMEESYLENRVDDKEIEDNIPKQVYSNYQNQNTFDKEKKSIKLDEDQSFPQFSLNVSNPISWKLMLLIMLGFLFYLF